MLGLLPRLDYENELLFGLLAGWVARIVVGAGKPVERFLLGWRWWDEGLSRVAFRQTLSFSLNKRQLASFSFAFLHCSPVMCVSVCQAKPCPSHPCHPIHLGIGIGIVHFPKTNNPHSRSISSDDDLRFKLCTESALIEVFLSQSLALHLYLFWLCVLGKCKLWLPWRVPTLHCHAIYRIPYTISDICLSSPCTWLSTLFFTFFWAFVIDEGSLDLCTDLEICFSCFVDSERVWNGDSTTSLSLLIV